MRLVAQEVEPVFPELVMTAIEGMKSVEYSNFVGVLIESTKPLAARNAEPEKRVERLERALEKQSTAKR